MRKKIVNEYLFDDIALLIALSGHSNNPQFAKQFDPDSEESVKECVRQYIKPRIKCLTKENVAKIRSTLEYFSFIERDMSGFWYSLQDYPIQYPTDIRRFTRWVGEELFGSDFSPCKDPDQYIEVPDEAESLLQVRITE